MDFDLQWLLWSVPLAFALGWVASRWDFRQWRRDVTETPKVYYKGLNFLLNEQHDKAIDAFIEAVQQDPDTSDLHFALGNLFRRRGEHERAVRVHEYLLNRADLPKAERERARHELAQDFMKAGLLDRAEAAYQALAGTAFDTESRLALLSLHERSRAWQAAIGVARELEQRGAGSFASRISHFFCELAVEADAAHQPDDAEAHLRDARAAAPQAPRPLVLTGQRAAAAGEHERALRAWGALLSAQSAWFNLVAHEYAASAEALGRAPAALEQLAGAYRQNASLELLDAITRLDPDPASRRARLIEHLRQHPTLAAALALLASARDADREPESPSSDAAAIQALRVALRRAARPLHRYRCAACGFEAEHYFWQCPGCLGWDTYPPRRLEDFR
ncbi:lipopolysaccharide assembly protein LapB [Piscinibacter koreensis]|uniref:Lipopolysaccharide assembly protein B n=1 Tax=Piscinibacter koreensis TaxID=2742824 RepID=A0A7Y6TXJ0_9BURK|nr:lipopolysaccharide assembly protein LapB [Schlegelella koreensis]NUZ07101.1 lipopolysaccharide assembly protein LapB [Schlegelella koreensis]